jgi:hypothetical protein
VKQSSDGVGSVSTEAVMCRLCFNHSSNGVSIWFEQQQQCGVGFV